MILLGIKIFTTTFFLWLVFTGYISYGSVFAGIIVSVITTLITLKVFKLTKFTFFSEINLIKIPLYVLYMLKEIFIANLTVAKVIFTGKVKPELITIKNKTKTSSGEYMLAISITLTPGTLIVQYDQSELLIHLLDDSSKSSLLSGDLSKAICKIEQTNHTIK